MSVILGRTWSTVVAIAWLGAVAWATNAPVVGQPPPQDLQAATKTDPVKRGEDLVNAMGCHDCHTPIKMGPSGPEPDMTFALSGHQASTDVPKPPAPSAPWVVSVIEAGTAWSGPWGVSFTANLTPDPETGLGQWTEQQFVETIRNGRHQGRGRQLLPPMPWPAFRNLNDDDLKAIFAYLKTVKPLKNKVPDPVIAAPPTGL